MFKKLFCIHDTHSGSDVNPANCLPMADDFVDIMGNPFGSDYSQDDLCNNSNLDSDMISDI